MEDNKKSPRQLEKVRQDLVNKARRLDLENKLSDQQKMAIADKHNQVKEAIARRIKEEREKPQVVKNVTDKIKTTERRRLLKGPEHTAKIKALRKLGKKGAAALGTVAGPLAGLVTALSTGDASAAVPVLGDSEPLGPEAGSLEAMVEDPSISREDREKVLKKLMNKNWNILKDE